MFLVIYLQIISILNSLHAACAKWRENILMTKDSLSSDPDRLALGGYDANLPPAHVKFGNVPDQKQKYHL